MSSYEHEKKLDADRAQQEPTIFLDEVSHPSDEAEDRKMGISVEEAIHELRNREEVFVAYSQATRLPYVTCDEETFNDQARFFATEEEIKEYGKQLLEDKILLMGMKYEKKRLSRLYGTLYAIGVNSVIWIDGEEKIEIEIGKIANQREI